MQWAIPLKQGGHAAARLQRRRSARPAADEWSTALVGASGVDHRGDARPPDVAGGADGADDAGSVGRVGRVTGGNVAIGRLAPERSPARFHGIVICCLPEDVAAGAFAGGTREVWISWSGAAAC